MERGARKTFLQERFLMRRVNVGAKNVSAYVIHATTGALTPVNGSPFRTAPNFGSNSLKCPDADFDG
jgi:hypothetical protein